MKIKCNRCGREWTIDEREYFGLTNFEYECLHCGRFFMVEIHKDNRHTINNEKLLSEELLQEMEVAPKELEMSNNAEVQTIIDGENGRQEPSLMLEEDDLSNNASSSIRKKQIIELRKAAEAGDIESMRKLGELYKTPHNVTWLKRAAEAGDSESAYHLGEIYASGWSEGSLKKSAKWRRKAAESNHLMAMFKLGLMYLEGKGVVQNETKALNLITSAASAGNKEAIEYLAGNQQKYKERTSKKTNHKVAPTPTINDETNNSKIKKEKSVPEIEAIWIDNKYGNESVTIHIRIKNWRKTYKCKCEIRIGENVAFSIILERTDKYGFDKNYINSQLPVGVIVAALGKKSAEYPIEIKATPDKGESKIHYGRIKIVRGLFSKNKVYVISPA